MFISGKTCTFKWLLPLLVGIWLTAPLAAWAAPAPAESDQAAPIHITSDTMVVESAARSAEFIGNVRAVQQTTVITADRLKVFYKAEQDADPQDQAEAGAIKEIICTGAVVIQFDGKVAVGEKAVYTAENGVLVLTGPDAKVTSEKNSVVGEKITVFRNEDRMMVESGSRRRVEAVIFSKGKGLK